MPGYIINIKQILKNEHLLFDGSDFSFQWRPVGTDKFQTLPKEILAVIGFDFTYFTNKDKLYLSFPKEIGEVDILTLVAGLTGMKELTSILKSLLIQQSGYYLFPVNQAIEEGKGEFYISEDMISKVATIAEPMMEGIDFGDYDRTVQPILAALKTAKIGLPFTKE